MSNASNNLEKVFHEPTRLAILSEVCALSEPISFTELRETCALTDGNLSRHLKTLEEAGVIRLRKTFADNKPRTTVEMTHKGRAGFLEYLDALEDVLKKAARRVKKLEKAGESQTNLSHAKIPKLT